MAERVVVTGIGVLSSVGIGKDDFWKNLLDGKSGIKRVTLLDPKEQSACKIAGEISDFDPLKYVDAKQARRQDRFIQFAIAAAKLAYEDADLEKDRGSLPPERLGVVAGSAAGGLATFEKNHKAMLERGPEKVSPFTVPMLIVNMAAGWISILFNARGPNLCSVTACATSAHSIGDAFNIIRRGDADVMFAGGSEAPITPLCMAGFAAARTMSTRNDEPEKASRPFDKGRDGFVMAEGGAILILESLTFALNRGARIYAEVSGYGATGDAYDIVAPSADGEGAARSMEIALKDGGLRPEDINYINAHGTSTTLGDRAETAAIRRVFGAYADKVPVSSTKSMTGHLLGAAGAIEAAISCLAISERAVPPTTNLDNPDELCDLDYVPHTARRDVDVTGVMSNSFGFGGHNASLVFKKYVK